MELYLANFKNKAKSCDKFFSTFSSEPSCLAFCCERKEKPRMMFTKHIHTCLLAVVQQESLHTGFSGFFAERCPNQFKDYKFKNVIFQVKKYFLDFKKKLLKS